MSDKQKNVVIIDYGIGNLFSIARVIKHLGGIPIVSRDPSVISSADRLILPGVGAFGDGMSSLKERQLESSIKEFVSTGRPLLGICLGMQLLMTYSEEFGFHQGLNLIQGTVKKLPDPSTADCFYKIPHIGWNKLDLPSFAGTDSYWKDTILDGLDEGVFAYFVHSYVVAPNFKETIISETEYGNNTFCSAIRHNNLFGCQFHPEVSSTVGLHIIKNFLFNL